MNDLQYERGRRSEQVVQGILAAICILIFGIILVAGLSPFQPHPKNEVDWLRNGDGLRLGENGVVVSEQAFHLLNPGDESSASLELWLRPAMDDVTTILAFYRSAPRRQFSLLQYGGSLLLQVESETRYGRSSIVTLEIDRVFQAQKGVVLTLTSGAGGTSVYVDGVLAKRATAFAVKGTDVSGSLVLGTPAFQYDTWRGEVRGLAVYERCLTASEVERNYRRWKQMGGFHPLVENGQVALYLFDEGQGRVAHNRIASQPDLVIPETFGIVQKSFLESPWRDFQFDWSSWQDILLNIGGFIPLGFFFLEFTVQVMAAGERRRGLSAPVITIAIGGAVSLLIETLQFYLPTRDSSLTDLLTNIAGTVFGVALGRCTPLPILWRRVAPEIGLAICRAAQTWRPLLQAISRAVPKGRR